MSIAGQQQNGPSPAWYAAIVALAGAVMAVIDQWFHPFMEWWGYIPLCLGGFLISGVITLVQTNTANNAETGRQWLIVLIYRQLIWVNAGAWAIVTDLAGINVITGAWFGFGGIIGLGFLGVIAREPVMAVTHRDAPPEREERVDRRSPEQIEWEQRIREVTGMEVKVPTLEPWDKPQNGFRLKVDLPIKKGAQVSALVPFTGNLAAAARLRDGCVITVDDSGIQGVAFLDVMRRNVLEDHRPVYREPTTPASINDEFPVLTSARGELFKINLRKYAMLIGGTTGSGKTTLLHRIIMYLARCVDALIWIVDLNGGGVAEPWINAWATGRAAKPIIDWIARDEAEAALLVTCANEIAKDRKNSKEAARRKRSKNSAGWLPVDKDMPAIIVLADEGGTLATALGLLGQLAARGMTSMAQIGRAEGIRAIVSVLRGTSDLLDKGFRVVAEIRLCLRMVEYIEYDHILGEHPGNVNLGSIEGAGFLKTPNRRFVFGGTENVDLEGMDEHAVACARLRPDLDPGGIATCAKVTTRKVFGREPSEEQMEFRAMQDADLGRAYTHRWVRYEPELAAIRGDEFDPSWWAEHGYGISFEAEVSGESGGSSTPGLAAMMRSAGIGKPEAQAEAPARLASIPPQPRGDGRAQVLGVLSDAKEAGMRPATMLEKVTIGKSQLFNVLNELVSEHVIVKSEDGIYWLPQYAPAATSHAAV